MSSAAPNQTTTVSKFDPDRITTIKLFGSDEKLDLSVNIIKKLVAEPTRNKNTIDTIQAIKLIKLCEARQLNPFEGDVYVVGYDKPDGTATFSLITSIQAFLKRAEAHKEFDGIRSGVIVRPRGSKLHNTTDREGDFVFDDEELLGGWATVYFKTRTHPMVKRLKLSTYNKGRSLWKENPAGMICKCAEADALRSSFPSLLGGLYTDDEKSGDGIFDSSANAAKNRRVSRARPIEIPSESPQYSGDDPEPAGEDVPEEIEGELVEPPPINEDSEPPGLSDAIGEIPTKDDLANLAQSLGCDEGMCLGWAESALKLLEDGAIANAIAYITARPWKKPGKKI